MKYILYILGISGFLISCNHNTSKNEKGYKSSSIHKSDNIYDTSGFLSNCSELKGHMNVGFLQGTDFPKDSTGLFGFFDCYNQPHTYEIIFVDKGGIKSRSLNSLSIIEKKLDNGCNNSFSNFDCYAFVYPMRDPEKQDDMHALNIDFPLVVKAYSRVEGDNWKFINSLKAHSFKEFSKFQFNVIYNKK